MIGQYSILTFVKKCRIIKVQRKEKIINLSTAAIADKRNIRYRGEFADDGDQ